MTRAPILSELKDKVICPKCGNRSLIPCEDGRICVPYCGCVVYEKQPMELHREGFHGDKKQG